MLECVCFDLLFTILRQIILFRSQSDFPSFATTLHTQKWWAPDIQYKWIRRPLAGFPPVSELEKSSKLHRTVFIVNFKQNRVSHPQPLTRTQISKSDEYNLNCNRTKIKMKLSYQVVCLERVYVNEVLNSGVCVCLGRSLSVYKYII